MEMKAKEIFTRNVFKTGKKLCGRSNCKERDYLNRVELAEIFWSPVSLCLSFVVEEGEFPDAVAWYF
jgi:hypothetical protein